MEFWSTVTFKASGDDEQAALSEIMEAAGEVNPGVIEAVFREGTVVAEQKHCRALAETLQGLALREDRLDRMRRGLIKALAFNQHYVCNSHGWEPADVARRHRHDGNH
ncbi:MAG: hypothetical protein ACUVX1_13345 [Chloroflexota bacterium]